MKFNVKKGSVVSKNSLALSSFTNITEVNSKCIEDFFLQIWWTAEHNTVSQLLVFILKLCQTLGTETQLVSENKSLFVSVFSWNFLTEIFCLQCQCPFFAFCLPSGQKWT